MIISAILLVIIGVFILITCLHLLFWKKKWNEAGTFFSFLYLTIAYSFFVAEGDSKIALQLFQPYIRIGILVVFINQAIINAHTIYELRIKKHGP